MRKQSNILLLLIVIFLASCSFSAADFVDFNLPDSLQVSSMFRVVSQRTTDLHDGFPADCYLLDGTPMSDVHSIAQAYDAAATNIPSADSQDNNLDNNNNPDVQAMRRANSVPLSSIVQSLLDKSNSRRVIELSGTYSSVDVDGSPILLSGKLMLPADGKVKRIILVSHYTIGSDAEAPSNCFSIEGILCPLGYALIIPDYLGYGVTRDRVHPYLCMDITATNVIDMFFACRTFMEACGVKPEYEDIFIMGYSQGGANSMAVCRLFETLYSEKVKIRRVFTGGGPYDVLATYDQFVSTDVAGYPVAVPLVMQGMVAGSGLNLRMEDMMQPFLYEHLDEWINSKQYTTAQINEFIGSYVTHELLTEYGMDPTSAQVAQLYKVMNENSVINYGWSPNAPIYMMHSLDDETVPYINAIQAKATWSKANIQYNFGHYGGHVPTALRFFSTVKTILEQEENQ